jgi:predicted nucleic acid-binding protein
MGVILDTSIWIDVERGRLTSRDIASVTGEEPVYCVPPVIAELEYGVHRASNDAQKNRRAVALARIRKKPCLTIDKDTAEVFGRITASLDKRGKPSTYRTHDLWIASVAIQHNLSVLTRNRSDFADIPGLKLLAI